MARARSISILPTHYIYNIVRNSDGKLYTANILSKDKLRNAIITFTNKKDATNFAHILEKIDTNKMPDFIFEGICAPYYELNQNITIPEYVSPIRDHLYTERINIDYYTELILNYNVSLFLCQELHDTDLPYKCGDTNLIWYGNLITPNIVPENYKQSLNNIYTC